MNAGLDARIETFQHADTIALADDAGEPVSAWSLEEFDEFAELGSRRSSWDGADSRYA